MPPPALELASLFRRHGPAYRLRQDLPLAHLRVMRAIESCRTAALGGHVERCHHCAFERIAYNSCRNRHCPKCQTMAKLKWLHRRERDLLPIPYFHVVFTLPRQIAAIALQNKKVLFQILLRASAQALLTIAADPRHLGAEIGFFSILHTWGQNLLFHPHVHAVVTGGGLSPDSQRWISSRPHFFLSVRVLSRLFRRLFLEALARAFDARQLQFHGDLAALADPRIFAQFLDPPRHAEWVVYAKAPFGGPRQVIAYLGRYTHRVALSNQRLLAIDNDSVTFQYKDYRSRQPQRSRSMTLPAEEFLRRFLLHVLPDGFQRIRYYGLLANRFRSGKLRRSRELLLGARLPLRPDPSQFDPIAASILERASRCPRCPHGVMFRLSAVPAIAWSPTPDSARAPP